MFNAGRLSCPSSVPGVLSTLSLLPDHSEVLRGVRGARLLRRVQRLRAEGPRAHAGLICSHMARALARLPCLKKLGVAAALAAATLLLLIVRQPSAPASEGFVTVNGTQARACARLPAAPGLASAVTLGHTF